MYRTVLAKLAVIQRVSKTRQRHHARSSIGSCSDPGQPS